MFTWNNYPDDWADVIKTRVAAVRPRYPHIKWIGGEEVAPTTGTPHIQGYIEFSDKARGGERVRPMSALGLPKEVHWGDKNGKPCRGTREENIEYCSKECRNVVSTFKVPRPLWVPEIYGWQLDAAALLVEDFMSPTWGITRHIHWFWEPNGCMGKTFFCRWAAASHPPEDILMVCGRPQDMKDAIVNHEEKHGAYPEMILLDVPRKKSNHFSYAGLEEVRNGLFCSPKFKSSMVLMNPPKLMVMANFEPEEGALSSDRIKVHRVVKPDSGFALDACGAHSE